MPLSFFLQAELEPGLQNGPDDEADQVPGRADYWNISVAEAVAKTADLARKHGISEATPYNWKAKFGSLDLFEARWPEAREDENWKLKERLAESVLDQVALKELLTKKW